MFAQRTLSAFMPVLGRHLKVYVDTAAADAALLANDLRRRLLAAVIALAGTLMCLILGSAWIAGMAWNTPWRVPVLASMLGAFLLCALAGAVLAARPFTSEPFARLRSELGSDQAVPGGLSGPASLQQSRGEALDLVSRATRPAASGTFPRSATLRLLLNWTGIGASSAMSVRSSAQLPANKE